MIFPKELEDKTNEELLSEYKINNDEAVKQLLVVRYVYIVKMIAMQMRGVYLSFAQLDDIVNEGVIALIHAIDKFDPDKNVKFETFISKRIRGLIIDLARKQDWVPRNVKKSAKSIDSAANILFDKLGRYPTDREIADYLHISIEKYWSDMGNTNLFNMLSLDSLIEETGTNEQKRFQLLNTNPDNIPEQILQTNENEKVLEEALSCLRKNEQLVISLYYRKELNMKEIASVLEISEPRVSQIHANAIRKLRIHMERYMKED